MTVQEFIQEEVLRSRLKSGVLVVYDVRQRYRDLCLGLAGERIRIIDATVSSIESREQALTTFLAVGKGQLDGVLVYVPSEAPLTDEQKQLDPFALYTACGSVFPANDGDEYLSLCLRARPDHATEIRRLFKETPEGPPFAVIDALGGGVNWPQLRALLQVVSAREILLALMTPSDRQAEALKAHEGWVSEARAFLEVTIGLALKTRSKALAAVSDEVWRFVLFSEFAFDLPTALPDALAGVPHALSEARPIIDDICEQLRSNAHTRTRYIERAEKIETELNLARLCAHLDDLGERDTFPFEERTFLSAAIRGIANFDMDVTRRILVRHKHSVWAGKDESQAQWELVRAAQALVEACEDLDRQLPDHSRSQADLLDFYVGSLREADRLQREFEQAVAGDLDPDGLMSPIIQQARGRYRKLSERVQSVFVRHLETSGWPPPGRAANVDAFDRLVADRLKESDRRVAYILVDALRYELGVTLERMLAEDGPVELQPAYAQLPTITPVGMASLLPGARTRLTLTQEQDGMLPRWDGLPLSNVNQRMDVLRRHFGDRFAETTLSEFVRGKSKVLDTVDLLVLRSTEIDSQLENNPESTLSLLPGTLKSIRVALHKLRGLGFRDAVIVTDHGFFLNAQAEAGDVCAKPPGTWPLNAHDRMLFGEGTPDSNNLVLPCDRLGLPGTLARVAVPRSMAPYRAGHLYFHGGASLQEAVVPWLVARLDMVEARSTMQMKAVLTYRNGAKRITTRTPVIEIKLEQLDMFSQFSATAVEVLIEAQDTKGNVVGEPRQGADVDPSTRTVTLLFGQSKQIALRMDPDYEGKFTVKALDPVTLTSYASLQLETDYTV